MLQGPVEFHFSSTFEWTEREKAILNITLTTKVTYIIFDPVTHNSDFIVCHGYRSKFCRKPLVSILVQVDVNYKVSHWFQQTAFPEPMSNTDLRQVLKALVPPSTNPPTLIQPFLYTKPEWDIQNHCLLPSPLHCLLPCLLTVSEQPYSEENYLIYTLKRFLIGIWFHEGHPQNLSIAQKVLYSVTDFHTNK